VFVVCSRETKVNPEQVIATASLTD